MKEIDGNTYVYMGVMEGIVVVELYTVHATSYLWNYADLPHRFSLDFRAATCGRP